MSHGGTLTQLPLLANKQRASPRETFHSQEEAAAATTLPTRQVCPPSWSHLLAGDKKNEASVCRLAVLSADSVRAVPVAGFAGKKWRT